MSRFAVYCCQSLVLNGHKQNGEMLILGCVLQCYRCIWQCPVPVWELLQFSSTVWYHMSQWSVSTFSMAFSLVLHASVYGQLMLNLCVFMPFRHSQLQLSTHWKWSYNNEKPFTSYNKTQGWLSQSESCISFCFGLTIKMGDNNSNILYLV